MSGLRWTSTRGSIRSLETLWRRWGSLTFIILRRWSMMRFAGCPLCRPDSSLRISMGLCRRVRFLRVRGCRGITRVAESGYDFSLSYIGYLELIIQRQECLLRIITNDNHLILLSRFVSIFLYEIGYLKFSV